MWDWIGFDYQYVLFGFGCCKSCYQFVSVCFDDQGLNFEIKIVCWGCVGVSYFSFCNVCLV